MEAMKLKGWMLVFLCAFLFVGCKNTNDSRNISDSKISNITYDKWLYNDGGSLKVETEAVVVTDTATNEKIIKALNVILKGKTETTYNKIPSTYQYLTINYSDGASIEIEANQWCGILVGTKHYDCTEEEFRNFQSTLYK